MLFFIKNPIFNIVGGVIFIFLGMGLCLVPIWMPTEPSVIVLAVLLCIGGIAMLFLGGLGLIKRQQGIDRINMPGTLAGQTYGKAGNYVYFAAYKNKLSQDAANFGMNAVSAVAFAAGGVGVFGRHYRIADVFVSPDEIAINEKHNNPACEESGYIRIPLAEIANISVALAANVTVNIQGASGKTLTLDIISGGNLTNEQIFYFFKSLKSPQPNFAAQNAPAAPAPPERESAAQVIEKTEFEFS